MTSSGAGKVYTVLLSDLRVPLTGDLESSICYLDVLAARKRMLVLSWFKSGKKDFMA
jgi:hypothetical protein